MDEVETPRYKLYIITGSCLLFGMLYSLLGVPPSQGMWLILAIVPPLAVVTWLAPNVRRHGLTRAMDAGFFLYLLLPFAISWYSWKTRQVGRWALMLELYALMLAGLLGVAWGAVLKNIANLTR